MAITGKLKTGEAVSFTEEGKDSPTLGIVTYDPNDESDPNVFVLTSVSTERQIARSNITERVSLSDLEKTLNRRALGNRTGKGDSVARAELDRVHRLRQVQKIAPSVHANHVKARAATATPDAEADTAPLTEGSAVPAPLQATQPTEAGE